MNLIIKSILSSKLYKEDRKFIAPHFRCGVVTPKDLRRIADVCESFPEAKLKLGAEIIIGGITDTARNEELRRMLGMPTFSVAGFCVRPVKACAGGFICANNLDDSFSLASKLDEIFCGKKLPFKMIISVSGCPRCCSEPKVRDIGIVASRQGYSLFVGGAAGARPRVGIGILDKLSQGQVIDIIERIMDLYAQKAKTLERLGAFIERIGLERFKEMLLKEIPASLKGEKQNDF